MSANKSSAKYVAPPPSVQEGKRSEPSVESEEEPRILPPIIITNPRQRIDTLSITPIEVKKTETIKIKNNAEMWFGKDGFREPIPKHPICLGWWPKEMCFPIDQDTVTKKLHITNRSKKIMYVHICGLCDKSGTARLGASWKCYPRTRIFLAPGLGATLYVTAKPREESPVQYVCIGLQLAAAHKTDLVIGYFVVPITVAFHNYISPIEECKGEEIQEN